ncbi:Quercetin 2,3-dioxygenase [Andreprevotia sp. IGB-42]|uniref:pirin family protein n=1 Tax=Andreprevotia sp. IGB-42 TaxID=2497473 RepID=UPI0013568CF8|nr:pirin family protein [Andreprevotia sp. IGB-42]KAF0813002.1 Quercetin 2,3-dioxygenase [Andreprevotia sp. IGB-42]
MIIQRKAQERGHANHGWLDSWHSFSFAGYYDPAHVNFGALRVINDDRIAAGMGFGTHPHRDMEIITYMLAGELAHKDSMGNGSVIKTGSVQQMSAGTGVQHSEYNPSDTAEAHLLQIWIIPNVEGVQPSYAETQFTAADKRGHLRLIVSEDGREGSIRIHQDARIHAGLFSGEEAQQWAIPAGRRVYVHLAKGKLQVNGLALSAGDALMLTDESSVILNNGQDADVLVFELD